MVRSSLTYVSWKHRKQVAGDLWAIYQASTLEQAEVALDRFAGHWDEQYPTISRLWRRPWKHPLSFFAFLREIRKIVYTTNFIESTNR